MKEFYTCDTFSEEKYKRTSWKILLNNDSDGKIRMIVRVATGRKYWPLFSVNPIFKLGVNDPALKLIKFSLNDYTHPMIDRFIKELNIALTDIYKEDIDLYKIDSGIKRINYYSSHNF